MKTLDLKNSIFLLKYKMQLELTDIYDLCNVRRSPEEGNIESILIVNSNTALFLIKKIIKMFNYNIIDQDDDEEEGEFVLYTDIPYCRICRMTLF